MSILAALLLLLAHLATGLGLLHLFRVKDHPISKLAVAAVVGATVASMVPMLLEMAGVPITASSVFIAIGLLATAFTALSWRPLFAFFASELKRPKPKIFEYPFLVLLILLVLSSVWRAFYFPPNARDMLSGPEPIAEFAVRENTMRNSVLHINLETTNNHLKPAFISGLQIIYKLAGFPFGQVWLSIFFISLLFLLYRQLREQLHPILAHALLLLFVAIPELYSYSFIMLFDFPNMVLFTMAFCTLVRFFVKGNQADCYFAAFLFGLATWIRSETILFTAFLLPLFWWQSWRSKQPLQVVAAQSVLLLALPFFFYAIWVEVFLKHFMPGGFAVGNELNKNLLDFRPLFERFRGMNESLLFGGINISLWNYFIYITLGALAIELIAKRKLSAISSMYLYGVLTIYLALPVIGHLIPLVDLMHTTKRGLFKMMPLLTLLTAHNALVRYASDWLDRYQFAAPEPTTVAATVGPQTVTGQKASSASNKQVGPQKPKR